MTFPPTDPKHDSATRTLKCGSVIRQGYLVFTFLCDPVLNHLIDLGAVQPKAVVSAFDSRCTNHRRIRSPQFVDERLDIDFPGRELILLGANEEELP